MPKHSTSLDYVSPDKPQDSGRPRDTFPATGFLFGPADSVDNSLRRALPRARFAHLQVTVSSSVDPLPFPFGLSGVQLK